MSNYFNFTSQNKNARIRSRVTQNGKLRTETSRRDDGAVNLAMTTDSSGASRLNIDLQEGASFALTGRQARTLYRLLRAHYKFARKSR